MGTYSTIDNLAILYEDNHIIIVNKRSGDLVQGDKTGDMPLSELVKKYIAQKFNKPGAVFLGVVHRLDRPTTGIVVFARTSKALARLNALFVSKDIHKTYWAVVGGIPEDTKVVLKHYLKRNNKQNKSYAHIKPVPDSKEALLTYNLIKKLQRYSLLEIELHTGRHHQIRAQLAAIKCFIKGDLKYGAPRSNTDGGIHLHARKIEFIHPVKKETLTIIAPTPNDALWEACHL